ncbi:MAG: hypothetical protein ABII27_08920 [bacterium]
MINKILSMQLVILLLIVNVSFPCGMLAPIGTSEIGIQIKRKITEEKDPKTKRKQSEISQEKFIQILVDEGLITENQAGEEKNIVFKLIKKLVKNQKLQINEPLEKIVQKISLKSLVVKYNQFRKTSYFRNLPDQLIINVLIDAAANRNTVYIKDNGNFICLGSYPKINRALMEKYGTIIIANFHQKPDEEIKLRSQYLMKSSSVKNPLRLSILCKWDGKMGKQVILKVWDGAPLLFIDGKSVLDYTVPLIYVDKTILARGWDAVDESIYRNVCYTVDDGGEIREIERSNTVPPGINRLIVKGVVCTENGYIPYKGDRSLIRVTDYHDRKDLVLEERMNEDGKWVVARIWGGDPFQQLNLYEPDVRCPLIYLRASEYLESYPNVDLNAIRNIIFAFNGTKLEEKRIGRNYYTKKERKSNPRVIVKNCHMQGINNGAFSHGGIRNIFYSAKYSTRKDITVEYDKLAGGEIRIIRAWAGDPYPGNDTSKPNCKVPLIYVRDAKYAQGWETVEPDALQNVVYVVEGSIQKEKAIISKYDTKTEKQYPNCIVKNVRSASDGSVWHGSAGKIFQNFSYANSSNLTLEYRETSGGETKVVRCWNGDPYPENRTDMPNSQVPLIYVSDAQYLDSWSNIAHDIYIKGVARPSPLPKVVDAKRTLSKAVSETKIKMFNDRINGSNIASVEKKYGLKFSHEFTEIVKGLFSESVDWEAPDLVEKIIKVLVQDDAAIADYLRYGRDKKLIPITIEQLYDEYLQVAADYGNRLSPKTGLGLAWRILQLHADKDAQKDDDEDDDFDYSPKNRIPETNSACYKSI